MAALSLSGLRAAAAIAVAVLACARAGPAAAAEITVRPGDSLAQAVARAAPGDRLRVLRGHYAGPVLVDKPLVIEGVDRPVVDGGLKGDTIRVTAKDVTLSGLIVENSGDDLDAQNAGISVQPGADRLTVSHCELVYNLFGVWINHVQDVHLVDNDITGKRDHASANRGNGIQLFNTQRAVIDGNEISFTRDGIYVDASDHAVFRRNRLHDVRYGTHYMNSNDNVWEDNESFHNRGGLALMETRRQVVRNNRAWGNTDHGIMLRTIQDSVIEGNVVAGNQRGFFIYDAEFNQIKDNLVVDNDVGMHVWAGSIHNQVDGNDFIGNHEQVRYIATRDEPWGGPQGNYWSNYLGWDRDGNGRGDVPYRASDLVDRLLWRFPAARLLLDSPAVQTLRLVSAQFPVLQTPSVVDRSPRMQPRDPGWQQWMTRR